MAFIAIAVVFGIAYFTRANNTPGSPDYHLTPMPSAPSANESETDSPKPPERSEPSQVPEQYSGIVAELTFTDSCWVLIKVDGETKAEGTNVAGTSIVLEGKNMIEFVSIGNAGGVDIKINGIDVAPVGKSWEVVRNLTITTDTVKNLSEENNVLPNTGS